MTRRKRPVEPAEADRLAVLPTMGPTLNGTTSMLSGESTDERRERELEDALREFGSDTRVKVYHMVEGRPTFAGETTADGLNEETLMDTFGGGDKTLVFYQGNEKKDRIRVSLDPSVPVKSPRMAGRPAVAGPSNQIADFSAIIAAMAQASMSSMTMMQTMMQASQTNMTMLLNAMTAMMAAGKGTDPMEMAVKIGELMKQNTGTAVGTKDLFEVFERGMNLRDKFDGSGDGGTLEIASKGLDIVGKLVAGQRPVAVNPPRLPPPRSEGTPMPAAAPPPAAVPPPPPTHDRAWVAAARPSFPLLSMAIGNVTPATAADMVYDRMSQVPDAFDDLLDDLEVGTADDFIARFEGYFVVTVPDATREWMRQLVAALLEMSEPDGDDDATAIETTGG